METLPQIRGNNTNRGRGVAFNDGLAGSRRPPPRNKQWVAETNGTRSGTATPAHYNESERWERAGHARGGAGGGGGRGRGANRGARRFPNATTTTTRTQNQMQVDTVGQDGEQEGDYHSDAGASYTVQDPDPGTPEEREKFYQELVRAREIERKRAIAEGKMDDPLVPKRLEDAITLVGTCMDMCPRFERYRRERENNLFEWETIPGTKRIDHKRAVKMYERAAGDKTLPSDLRPPKVLKRTLDYLFHDLLPRGGFSQTFNFIRDRSRAVRNDFTMQRETGWLAMECHDRCARFHILALHFERDRTGFSVALEEQQLMNTLQSLKEFYEDQRGRYESPTELEMRVYHRLIHIRDQKERHEDIPAHITDHPVFKLTTKFRLHVQAKSAPIGKNSPLVVDHEGMQIFGELALVLRQQGSVVMIYLVACLLERLFGKETIDNIESIRGDLSIPDLIDGTSAIEPVYSPNVSFEHPDSEMADDLPTDHNTAMPTASPIPLKPSATEWLSVNFGSRPTPSVIFGQPPSAPTTTAFPSTADASSSPPVRSVFSSLSSSPNPFGKNAVFGGPVSLPSVKPKSVFESTAEPTPSSAGHSEMSVGSISTLNAVPSTFTSSSTTTTQPPEVTPPSAPSFTAQPTIPPSLPWSNVDTFRPIQATTQTVGSSLSQVPFPSSSTAGQSPNTQTLDFTTSPTLSREPTLSFSRDVKPTPAPITTNSSQLFQIHQPFGTASSSSFSPATSFTVGPAAPAAESRSVMASVVNPPSSDVVPSPSAFPSSTALPTAPTAPAPAPTLHAIDTQSLEKKSADIIGRNASPLPLLHPPQLIRLQPISLPSTPTSPLTLIPSKSVLDSLKNQVGASGSPELLSPLYLPSPTTLPVRNFVGNGTPPSLSPKALSDPILIQPNNKDHHHHIRQNGKGKQPAADFNAMALAFSRKSLLVKDCFDHWQQRTTDRAAWIEAVEHSDQYRQKIQHERKPRNPTPEKKKRRLSTALPPQSSQKRSRRRISSEYQAPRTDEELARRFKENQEEHERRWAKGSFLEVIKKRVGTQYGTHPPNWRIWLSMNPENDGTAIWLECKFDVPVSGEWESESVYSIPLSSSLGLSLPPSPGVIVFECTPVEGLTDDLERKFRVLDDCARLRDIVKALPVKRHFIPSLLVICWAGNTEPDTESDFVKMITKFIEDSVLASYHILCITSATRDLDQKLDEALQSLTLDVEGKLVLSFTLPALFKVFHGLWTPVSCEWVAKCVINGEFDWALYAQIVEVSVKLLNKMAHRVLNLLEADPIFTPLPSIDIHDITDTQSFYNAALSWLENDELSGSEAAGISRDLLAHQHMGREFPTIAFLDHLRDLTQYRTESHIEKDSVDTPFSLPKTEIASALEQFQHLLQSHTVKLLQVYSLHVRRSPKRRGVSEESGVTMSSSGTKRRKLSTSADTSVCDNSYLQPNGRGSPSPNPSTASTVPAETITISMLRALTKDIKEKYRGK